MTTITIIWAWWFTPTLITAISIFWALFIVRDNGGGWFNGFTNIILR